MVVEKAQLSPLPRATPLQRLSSASSRSICPPSERSQNSRDTEQGSAETFPPHYHRDLPWGHWKHREPWDSVPLTSDLTLLLKQGASQACASWIPRKERETDPSQGLLHSIVPPTDTSWASLCVKCQAVRGFEETKKAISRQSPPTGYY